jgi:hypothetical protein
MLPDLCLREASVLQDFFAQLNTIHPLIGDLAEWATIGLLLTVTIFLISIPAHIIAEAMRGPVNAAAAFLFEVARAIAGRAGDFLRIAKERPVAFAGLARYAFVFDHHESGLRRQLQVIERAARNFPNAVNERTAALEAGIRRLTDQIENLKNLELAATLPDLPDIRQLEADSTAHRSALSKFVIALLLAPALVSINTLVLQEFFRGVVTIYVLGISLSWILSIFFSILELGLGIWIYAQQQKSASGDVRSIIAELVMFASIIALAAVECFFYSILSAQIDPEILRPLFAPDPVPSWALFWLAPFGPVIVVVLAFTGHAMIEGWEGLRHGKTARMLRRRLSDIESAGGKMVGEFEVAKGHAGEFDAQARKYKTQLVGRSDRPPALSQKIGEATQLLAATADRIALDRREPHAALLDGEVTRLFYTQALLGLGGMFVIGLFFFIQVAFLPRLDALVPAIPDILLVIAVVEAGVVLGASYMLSHAVRIVIEETQIKVVATPRDWLFGSVAVLAILAIIGFNIFLILRENSLGEWLWVALAMACIGYMIYVGRNLGLLVAALWNVLKGALCLAAAAIAWMLAALFAIIRAVLLALNGLLAILSYPFKLLMRPFQRASRTEVAVAR